MKLIIKIEPFKVEVKRRPSNPPNEEDLKMILEAVESKLLDGCDYRWEYDE